MHHNSVSVDVQNSNPVVPQPALAPKLARRGAGECIEVLGQRARVRIGSRNTGGVLALLELEIRPHEGAPYHVHRNEDEVFLVRQGRFEFIVDGTRHELAAGDLIYGPRDVPHTFRNLESCPGTLQVVVFGSGIEEFFRRCAEALAIGSGLQALTGLAAAHGIEFIAADTPPASHSQSAAMPKVIRATDAGTDAERLEAFGDSCYFHLDSRETAGKFCGAMRETPSCSGPPLHMHEREDELFLIESGCYEFQLGSARIHASAGDAVWAPRCVPHTFRIISDTPGHMLAFATPGGFDEFFRASAQLFEKQESTPEQLALLGTQYGIHFPPADM